MYDLIIRNGTVYDGTGRAPITADVAINGETIVAVGDNLGAAREEIDATGHIVTPGFVDAHTHVVYAGDRVDEFEMRIRGATYIEIMEAGGGILMFGLSTGLGFALINSMFRSKWGKS